ncbi:hypothetical protein NQ318_009807 [Aromia moschata]|uniref:Uncharacterized protein n=1 Tax=Aromia moschata TaxID=1265417 RepID=A0AAV8XLC3_9CUCU|nr:hypothetical protein NQ318_009807 [Aromia moschata]
MRSRIDIKNRRASVQLLFDKVTIVGKYEVNGRILILPIQGDGDINVTTDALNVHYTVDYTTEQKDGEDYIVPVNAQSDFTVKKASFHLSNLFNGNEQLGTELKSEATNKVLNDEWDKFVEAIKPAMNNLISEIATGIVKTITSKIPYNDFFPE